MRSVFTFVSFRRYLEAFYHNRKESPKGYSYRAFAEATGVKLTNYLGWLIDGTRNLSQKQLPGVIKAIGLNKDEAEYFSLLVSFEQAKHQSERNEIFGEIVSIRAQHAVPRVEEHRHTYYSHWYIVAIRELLNVVTFNPTERDGYYRLGSMLRPRITRAEARKAVNVLVDLGFIYHDKDGTLRLTNQQITTGDEAPGFYMRGIHTQMLNRAIESMDLFPSDERDISGIAMSVSREGLEKIKKAIQSFRCEIEEIVAQEDKAECVVQLNTQLFPMAVIPDEMS